MTFNIVPIKKDGFFISKNIHSVFFEYFGHVIYDGIWVGKDSSIPNIDGIRLDVIEGCREIAVGAMRWPGGCCADHYHWKNGIGKERPARIHPIRDPGNPIWRHDFGTDEFLRFCSLTGADPVITINTATGTPEEFLDWFEYLNGPQDTKYGALRAENGHPDPYNVKYFALGNTDENVWHIDFNNPTAYAQDYLRYQTVLREDRADLYFIGLGLSTRHKMPGWCGKALDHITRNGRDMAPNALSVHHYLGAMKGGANKIAGDAVEYSDEAYYGLLDLLEYYQYDIDLHRIISREHTAGASKISFDEWGTWHPEGTMENNTHQRQTMRDAIFAALTLHIFYKNSDIVEFAMETQLSNLLQSLFETDGEKFYKTPTYYVMKLFCDHREQNLIYALPDNLDKDIDAVASLSEDGKKTTVTVVNRHLYDSKKLSLKMSEGAWKITKSDIVTSKEVRDQNTFDKPFNIKDEPFEINNINDFTVPPHSILRICFEKTV